jgi:hypothetical protein
MIGKLRSLHVLHHAKEERLTSPPNVLG